MRLSFNRFYWLKLAGGVLALILSLLYLAGFELFSLVGFAIISAIAIYIGIKINNETMPAQCDLCGNNGIMKAEYDAGFSNAKLILVCESCGRVINRSSTTVRPEKE